LSYVCKRPDSNAEFNTRYTQVQCRSSKRQKQTKAEPKVKGSHIKKVLAIIADHHQKEGYRHTSPKELRKKFGKTVKG